MRKREKWPEWVADNIELSYGQLAIGIKSRGCDKHDILARCI